MPKTSPPVQPATPAAPHEPDAYTVEAFCTAHRISRSTVYQLWDAGIGPAIMRVGKKVLISRESAAKWRRSRETAAKKARAA